MIRLSASAFDILWADLGHPRPPEPLSVPSVGVTHEDRADIRQAVYGNLADRGLFAGGRLDPVLEARLDTLAAADVVVECEALADMTADEPFRAVAASRGEQAVLAIQPSQTIALSAINPGEVFSVLVDILPELRPGPGYGVSLPASALGGNVEDPVFGDQSGGQGTSGRSGSYDRQLREVLAIQTRPVYSAGQFSVRARATRSRLERVGGLSWFVTDVGAYFGTVTSGRNGQEWVNVAPADGPRLAGRLAAVLERH
jgi:hypothetical protein